MQAFLLLLLLLSKKGPVVGSGSRAGDGGVGHAT
jgi:hypothetical protein